MRYDLVTRWLHACIVLTITVQLISSGIMDLPKPGRMILGTGIAFFKIHQWSGISAFTLLALHWIWALTGQTAGGLTHLFPWLSSERARDVISDLQAMPRLIRSGFPEDDRQGMALAGAVHGLGLITVTGMAVTGSIVFFGIGPDGSMSGFIHFVKEFHQFTANFLWAFLAGHVSMAFIHQWRGDRVLTRMFTFQQE